MFTLVVWFVVMHKLVVVPDLDGINCLAERYEFRTADYAACHRAGIDT